MWQFNIELFRALPKMLEYPNDNAFRAALGYSNAFWYNVVYREDIRIVSLMDICNRFSLDINAFFIDTDNPQLRPDLHSHIASPQYSFAWQKSISVTNGNKSPKLWKEIMPKSAAFTTRQRYMRTDGTSSITAKVVAQICNDHCLTPSQFWEVVNPS